jgi:hypothetical protein
MSGFKLSQLNTNFLHSFLMVTLTEDMLVIMLMDKVVQE